MAMLARKLIIPLTSHLLFLPMAQFRGSDCLPLQSVSVKSDDGCFRMSLFSHRDLSD